MSRWKLLKKTSRYKDMVLDVEHHEYFFERAGRSADFTVVNLKDWVIVVPVDIDGNFIMVRQFRFGSNSYTLEFPGGAVDLGEDFRKSAPRELCEETGYTSQKITHLASIHPNPAFMSNMCHVFKAEECTNSAPLDPDEFEETEIVRLSKERLEKDIADGNITHSRTLAAYANYLIK